MNTNVALHINELRIGSIINGYKSTGEGWEPFVVTGKDIFQFEREINGDFPPNCPKGIDNIEPIPLTPEILEKCGFVMRNPREYDLADDFYIDQQFNVYYKVWEGSDDRGGLEPRVFRTIHSLHQLQNLYFSLTGEELSITM